MARVHDERARAVSPGADDPCGTGTHPGWPTENRGVLWTRYMRPGLMAASTSAVAVTAMVLAGARVA